MADIFLSYASEDFLKAKVLASALAAKGWNVFYDRTIPPGKTWRQVIGNAIEECRCMVVVWSNQSIDSNWVYEEAESGLERKILVPVFIEQVKPPWGFRSIQAADLIAWQGDREASEFMALCESITEIIGTTADTPPHGIKQGVSANQSAGHPKPISVIKPFEPEMVIIPAGSFQMGSNSYDDEKPIHTVTFSKSYALGKYPITFAEYDAYVESAGKPKPKDNGWGREKRPVINVDWQDACDYAVWLSQQTGKNYRLPSEAEWEYAVWARTTTEYYWGNETAKAKDYAWFSENSKDKTQPVGQLKANAFGLYDMCGNVWEWLEDYWHEDYKNAPINGSVWLQANVGDSTLRVRRGGSWSVIQDSLRSAARNWSKPNNRNILIGFRLAQDLP